MIKNEKCEDIVAVKVFQVLDNFSLAHVCETSPYIKDLLCFGHTVYVPKEKDKIYFDDQIIKPQPGKCFSFIGVYKYKSQNGFNHTIPKIELIEDEILNPEYAN